MKTRRIAVVGLNNDAAHAFHSMLKIVEGRASAAWSVSAPDDADVLMAGSCAHEPVIEHWARTDKPLIAVHEGAEGHRFTPFTLTHPFRVMQLLGVLDDVERSLESAPPTLRRCAEKAASSPWAFAESLRWLSRRSSAGHLYGASRGAAIVFVQDDLSAYHISAESLENLRRGTLRLPPMELVSLPAPAHFLRRPVFELAWFVGMHESGGLAPWLDSDTPYRLRRWPDFGMVRGCRAQLTLTAALARHALDRRQLAAAARHSLADVDHFLNACSISGLLATGRAHAAVPAAVPNTHQGFGGLIRRLRRHLGLDA